MGDSKSSWTVKGLLWQRILSAVVGIPILIAVVLTGGWPLFLGVVILVLVGLKEYHDMLIKMDIHSPRSIAYIGGLLLLGAAYFNKESIPAVLTLLFGLYLLALLWGFPNKNLTAISAGWFGTLYLGWMFSHLLILEQSTPLGAKYLLLAFILTWATDTGAYFAGRTFGRHKLAPVVSPNKTVEGAIGGILASLGAVALLFWVDPFIPSLLHGLIIATIVAVVGQFGDLVESVLKRLADVKDSGVLIPGHGGVLDRFDSILLTAPAVYYYISLFILV